MTWAEGCVALAGKRAASSGSERVMDDIVNYPSSEHTNECAPQLDAEYGWYIVMVGGGEERRGCG